MKVETRKPSEDDLARFKGVLPPTPITPGRMQMIGWPRG
jgi:hypothetical protein